MVMRCIFLEAFLLTERANCGMFLENVILLPTDFRQVQRKQILWLWECGAAGEFHAAHSKSP